VRAGHGVGSGGLGEFPGPEMKLWWGVAGPGTQRDSVAAAAQRVLLRWNKGRRRVGFVGRRVGLDCWAAGREEVSWAREKKWATGFGLDLSFGFLGWVLGVWVSFS